MRSAVVADATAAAATAAAAAADADLSQRGPATMNLDRETPSFVPARFVDVDLTKGRGAVVD